MMQKVSLALLLSVVSVALSQRDYYLNGYGGRGGIPQGVQEYSPSQYSSFNGLGGFPSFDAATELIEADFHKFGGGGLGGGQGYVGSGHGGGQGYGGGGGGHGGGHGFATSNLGIGQGFASGGYLGAGPGFGRSPFHGGFLRDQTYAPSFRHPFFVQPSYGSQYTFLRRSADEDQ